MGNSFYSPVVSHDRSGNSFGSAAVQAGYNPLDSSTGTKLYFSSRNTAYLKQLSTGTGAVSNDGDPVGLLTDQVQGLTLSQASTGLRPSYQTSVRNGNPVLRFGGAGDNRVLKLGTTALNPSLSLSIIASIKNGESSLIPSWADDFITLGNFPDVEFSLYNSFVDPVTLTLAGSSGTPYKNGLSSPLTLTQDEWLIAQIDVPSGFTQTDLCIGGNKSGSFFSKFDLMDVVFIQPTPSTNLLTQIYGWIRAPSGL